MTRILSGMIKLDFLVLKKIFVVFFD